MWYKNLLNSEIDGLEPLLSLFEGEKEFIEHFFKNVLFFKFEDVEKQSRILLESIKDGKQIPVRYTMKTDEYFHYNNDKIVKEKSKISFKNKKDAKTFALNQDYYHNETGIKICFDKDGNYYVRNEIYRYSGHRVSQGSISNVKNYVISHIWAKTENPYFFSSFWNIALIPNHLAFILDKSDGNSEVARKIKIISKAICYHLYNPNKLIGMEIIDEKELVNGLELAKIYIKDNLINYFEKTVTNKKTL
ncbi:hypothetical protein [Flavobacterium sp.]|uniref:hypothetical protein n=1 Tax=Flavobacterium sp. TaxID=239 RepID=UPI00286E7D2A|nr:hypothetical protein [Flavobacterium sp.]